MKHWIRFPIYLGIVLSLTALGGILWAGLSHRWLDADFRIALQHFRIACQISFVAIFVLLVSVLVSAWLKHRPYLTFCFLGLVISLPIAVGAFRMQRAAKEVPVIHDITTDTANPPKFVRILERRKKAHNSAVYGGKEIADQQAASYPYIVPVELSVPKEEVFTRSLRIIKDLGWELVEEQRDAGRIEATETSLLFGFKDDIVIRLTPTGSATRVDVRSASREGKSDLGVNARRIRKFLTTLMAQ